MKSNFSLRNFGEPPRPKSAAEIRNEICKKHGVGDYYYGYYGDTQYPRTIDDEARGLSNDFWKGIRDKVDSHVYATVNYSGTKNKIKYNIHTYESEIRKTPHIFDKVEKFRKTLDDYRKELNDIGVRIINAPNMQEADKIAEQLRYYNDLNFDSLRQQSYDMIKEFSVTLAGVEPPVNEGYITD